MPSRRVSKRVPKTRRPSRGHVTRVLGLLTVCGRTRRAFRRGRGWRQNFRVFDARGRRQCFRVFASQEALNHYARALEFAERGGATNEQIIYLFKQHGRVLKVIGRYEDALASYIKLHELAAARQDRTLELAYLMLRAPLHSAPMVTFDAALAEQLLLDALATAREIGR